MGSNVFVSYKYHDTNVLPIGNRLISSCRDYVDEIAKLFEGKRDYYFRGEKDGEDLSELNDTTIAQKLADKIYYTNITIVLISPQMKDWRSEKEQWIPWEISYSLKETARSTGKSHTNAVLAVVIPDRSGSYAHAVIDKGTVTEVQTNKFFNIIAKNMFNHYNKEQYLHASGGYDRIVCYIPIVKWCDFIEDPDKYLDEAESHRENLKNYCIVKTVD